MKYTILAFLALSTQPLFAITQSENPNIQLSRIQDSISDSDSKDVNVIFTVDRFKGPASSSGPTTTINTGTRINVDNTIKTEQKKNLNVDIDTNSQPEPTR